MKIVTATTVDLDLDVLRERLEHPLRYSLDRTQSLGPQKPQPSITTTQVPLVRAGAPLNPVQPDQPSQASGEVGKVGSQYKPDFNILGELMRRHEHHERTGEFQLSPGFHDKMRTGMVKKSPLSITPAIHHATGTHFIVLGLHDMKGNVIRHAAFGVPEFEQIVKQVTDLKKRYREIKPLLKGQKTVKKVVQLSRQEPVLRYEEHVLDPDDVHRVWNPTAHYAVGNKNPLFGKVSNAVMTAAGPVTSLHAARAAAIEKGENEVELTPELLTQAGKEKGVRPDTTLAGTRLRFNVGPTATPDKVGRTGQITHVLPAYKPEPKVVKLARKDSDDDSNSLFPSVKINSFNSHWHPVKPIPKPRRAPLPSPSNYITKPEIPSIVDFHQSVLAPKLKLNTEKIVLGQDHYKIDDRLRDSLKPGLNQLSFAVGKNKAGNRYYVVGQHDAQGKLISHAVFGHAELQTHAATGFSFLKRHLAPLAKHFTGNNHAVTRYEQQDEPLKYDTYKAPKGGMIVRGLYYKGGSMVPDLARFARSEMGKRFKLRWKTRKDYSNSPASTCSK